MWVSYFKNVLLRHDLVVHRRKNFCELRQRGQLPPTLRAASGGGDNVPRNFDENALKNIKHIFVEHSIFKIKWPKSKEKLVEFRDRYLGTFLVTAPLPPI